MVVKEILEQLPEKCVCGGTEFTWDVVKTVVLERDEDEHVWSSGEYAGNVKCSSCERVFIETAYVTDNSLIDQLIDA